MQRREMVDLLGMGQLFIVAEHPSRKPARCRGLIRLAVVKVDKGSTHREQDITSQYCLLHQEVRGQCWLKDRKQAPAVVIFHKLLLECIPPL